MTVKIGSEMGKAGPVRPESMQFAGAEVFPGLLDSQAQASMVADLRQVIRAAPLFTPVTRFGRAMSVRMTSAGRYGWVSDHKGYRYEPRHPTGAPWPPIPASLLVVWHLITGLDREPDCCLLNFYGEAARMGLHQDRDEASFDWPVVSVSLGDEALFRIGGTERGEPTQSLWLRSGDVLVLAGSARLAYHGIDRIRAGSSSLLPRGGRINLTMRVVD